jgi:hypothetical protein
MLKLNIIYTQQSEKAVVKTDYEALSRATLAKIRKLLESSPECQLKRTNAHLLEVLNNLQNEKDLKVVLQIISVELDKIGISDQSKIYNKLIGLKTSLNNYRSSHGFIQPKSRVKY